MYQRILVATDGSKLSTKAVNSAIELAALIAPALEAPKTKNGAVSLSAEPRCR